MISYQIIRDFATMGRRRNKLPNLYRIKGSDQTRVIWNGRAIYCGKYGTKESAEKYSQILKNITETGEAEPKKSNFRIDELGKKYLAHINATYHEDSTEPSAIERAINRLIRMHGTIAADSYGTARLTEFRNSMMDKLGVGTINKYHRYVLNMFRWAAESEMIEATVWHNLLTITKLRPGRSKAKDPKVVEPVPWDVVERTLPYLPDTVRDVVMMQWHTGMRSNEILSLKAEQIVNGVYRPPKHKTKWFGHKKEVLLGPRAMEIINRRVPDKNGKLFSGYTSASYWRSIDRNCKRNGIEHWHPHQIRHAKATKTLKTYGVSVTRAVLGHKGLSLLPRYAASSVEDARVAVEAEG